MKYNFEEIGKALVCFHIGRGGHFHNPGHKSYNPWVKSFGDLVNQDWLFLNNEDEEGNELDDDDWTLTDCSGNVLLEGRDEIEAETGTLSRDGEYDTDIVQRLEDCDDDEIELVYEEGTHHSLMDDDLLAYCCWRLDKKMIDTVDFDAPRACTVNFTDGTNGTITFSEGQDINDTIDDFFVENDIDDKSRDKWFDKIECEYDDCLERFTLYRDDNDLCEGWKCTDQQNGIVCRFKIHRFNETQQFEFNTDVDPEAQAIARLCAKWATGYQLIIKTLYLNMEEKKQHGGRRSGAGRPANDRSIMVGVRITKEAADILNAQPNKSEFIDNLIRQHG